MCSFRLSSVSITIAATASRVNLADNPLAGSSACCALDPFADELVAGNAAMAHIAPRQFEVGPAYSSHSDPNQALARWGKRIRIVVADCRAGIKYKSVHEIVLSWRDSSAFQVRRNAQIY